MDAKYEVTDVVTVRREFRVELPLDWKNMQYVMHRLERALVSDGRASFDDACVVTADEEMLTFSWPVPEPGE